MVESSPSESSLLLLLLLSRLLLWRKPGRRGRLPLRLMPTLLPRPTPGCCMEPTGTDLPTEGTTGTATTTPPMPTSEDAVTIWAALSPVPAVDKKERRCQQKIKIDSWNHVLISCFIFPQRVCQNIEIERRKF